MSCHDMVEVSCEGSMFRALSLNLLVYEASDCDIRLKNRKCCRLTRLID